MTGESDVLALYRRAQDAFGARLHEVGDDRWAAATPCGEWTVRDLANHVLSEVCWAVPLFAVSLLAVVLQMAGAYALTPAWQAYGPAGLAMPVLVLVIAAGLWVYAGRCRAGGWLR